jgi:hypothetical protein
MRLLTQKILSLCFLSVFLTFVGLAQKQIAPTRIIAFSKENHALSIVSDGIATPIAVSSNDFSGVVRVAKLLKTWEGWVSNNINQVVSSLQLERPGMHTLKIWMVDPGVVLQRIIIDCGGLKPSYLGPLESKKI